MRRIPEEEIQSITLQSYQKDYKQYLSKRDPKRIAAYWPGVDFFLKHVSPENTIFEIGSGSGVDANEIESQAFKVQRSDIVTNFLDEFSSNGKDVIKYNVLSGPLPKKYHAIFANAVLLHMNQVMFSKALGSIHASLCYGGLLCIGMKLGDFEGWREEGLEGKRYFKFWSIEALTNEVKQNGFLILNVHIVPDRSFAVITAKKQ